MADGFEKIEFNEMESSTEDKMTASDYAQVIFHDIAEFYPVDVNVECKYTVTSLLQPSKRDWVGVYKVGWTSSKEHIYYEWATMPCDYHAEKPFEGSITFRANTLPGDDGEFYQFCYVTSAGHVRGASTPFQFRRPSAGDFVEIEDLDDDIMVIKSKTTALEEQLGTVAKEREVLVKNKERLENERESLLSKLVDTEKKVKHEKVNQDVMKKELKTHQTKIDQLNAEAKDMLVVHDGLRDKIARLSEEKMSMTKLLEEKDSYIRSTQAKIKTLINEKDSIMGKNKMLEEEKDLYKNHFTSSENTLQAHIKEIDNLKKQLEAAESQSGELQKNKESLEAQIESLNAELADKCRLHEADMFRLDELDEILRSCELKIAALEDCKLSLGKELDTVTLTFTQVADKWEKSKEEAHSYKQKVLLLEEVNQQQLVNMGEQIQDLTNKLKHKAEENKQLSDESEKIKTHLQSMSQKKREEEEGPLFALQMAHESLKTRLQKSDKERSEMEKDVIELVRRKNSLENHEEEMQKEIEDLKERLLMGQEEYKEKYIECKRVYQEFKKLQRQVGSRRNSESPEKSLKSESECSTQTRVDTGSKHTETDKKTEVEQTTQTAVKVDKEIHTQTCVSGSEQQTQTHKNEGSEQQTQTAIKEGYERQTQTAVKVEAEQHTQTAKSEKTTVTQTEAVAQSQKDSTYEIDFADLTNPELQMQLDDLGRELENRTAKKQKYKEQYQREKEKSSYLQKHYFEEVDKKNVEIEELKKDLEKKQNVIYFLEQTLEGKNREIDRLKLNYTKGTIVYPPQSQQQSLQGITFQNTQTPQSPPVVYNCSPFYPPQKVAPIHGPRQPCPLYPVFYDRQPLLVYGRVAPEVQSAPSSNPEIQNQGLKTVVKENTDNNGKVQMGAAKKDEVVEDLDPLKNKATMTRSHDKDDIRLPPPLTPEETDDCKLTKILCFVNGAKDEKIMEIPKEEKIERFPEFPPSPQDVPVITQTLHPKIEEVLEKPADSTETLEFFGQGSVKPGFPVDITCPGEKSEGMETIFGEPIVPNAPAEPEDNDERFFDAPETKECPICNMTFPLNTPEEILTSHVDTHFTNTKDCPICKKKFSSNTDQKVFETHVQGHFNEDIDDEGMEV